MWSKLARFQAAKFYVALATPVAMLGYAMQDGVITSDELTKIALACVGAVLVYFAPNKPASPPST